MWHYSSYTLWNTPFRTFFLWLYFSFGLTCDLLMVLCGFIAVFTLYFFIIRDVVSDNPWTYGSTAMPLLLSFSTVFFMMLSSFFVFIFLCTADMVHCGYPHLRAFLVCSLSFCLSASSVTCISHMSSNVRITPILWCNGWCGEKLRY